MAERKGMPVWANFVNLILILGGIVNMVISLCLSYEKNATPQAVLLTWILTLVALICALVYAVMGYKKNVAKFFKIFVYVYALSQFIGLVAMINGNVLPLIINIIALLATLALVVIKNLGKKKSYIICGVVVLCSLVRLIALASISGIFLSTLIGSLVLSIFLAIMIIAKYIDKDERGTV